MRPMNIVFNQTGEGNTQIGSIGCGPEWVRTADRFPTDEDGIIGATGEPEVLAVVRYAHGHFPDMKMVSEICIPMGRKYYPYWLALPKLPEVEG